MSQPEDTELENYLAGDSPLSRAYRQAQSVEPPASVDEFVLSAARQTKDKRARRWLTPLAAAAVLVLGLTTTLSLLQDEAIVRMTDDSYPAESAQADFLNREAPDSSEEVRQQKSSPRILNDSPAAASAPAPAPPALQKRAAPAAELQSQSAGSRERKEGDTARNWIQRVRDLRQAGLEDAARREFAAFRSLYPDREVPDDLQDLDRALNAR